MPRVGIKLTVNLILGSWVTQKQSCRSTQKLLRCLTDDGKIDICKNLNLDENDVQILPLQQINTEEQFSKSVCKMRRTQRRFLIVQAQVNPEMPNSLIECTRYLILNQGEQHKETMSSLFCIILLLQVPRILGGFFSGFPGYQWKALHIDELCGDPKKH